MNHKHTQNKSRWLFLLAALLILVVACGPLTTYPATPTSSAIKQSNPQTETMPSAPSADIQTLPTATIGIGAAPSQPPTNPSATLAVASTEIPPTSTPSPTPTTAIRFAVIGDYGGGGRPERDVAEMVIGWQPDFIVTLGDNNYPDGAASTIDQNVGQFFHAYIADYHGKYGAGSDQQRFFPVLGNHDWNTNQAKPYFNYFNLPGNERYYDFTWGPVQFFMLDADSREPDGVSRNSTQAQWLMGKLAESNSPWKLVLMHQAPYSSGLHGSTDWMRWPFQKWGASAVLAGHDHTYERLQVDGIPYFVNGVGGGAIYHFNEILAESQFRYNSDYGAMLVSADEQQISFEFYSRGGELIDSYQIQK
jgi:tartrate-resistant acid phosphatase type 5